MKSTLFKKYNQYSLPKLLALCEKYSNKFIRERDKNETCISCDGGEVSDCGHYYNVKHYSAVRFNEINQNGQCINCNRVLDGNIEEYRKRLIERIGEEKVNELDQLVSVYKKMSFKWDRIEVIEKIEYFKVLIKQLDN